MSRYSRTAPAALHLPTFIPFRLNRLATAVSEHLSEIYRDLFGLEIPEWRVLVTVGPRRGCTAQYIVASTRMHKTRVSRAIASLAKRGLVERAASSSDKRALRLHLTRAGQRLYAALVPLALEREGSLLGCLTTTQRQGFLQALACLEEHLRLNNEGSADTPL